MKTGAPPTKPKARTGESTPPGMTARAASNRRALVTDTADAGLTLPAYTTADLALKWQPSDATTLALHGHNIFNRHYYSTVYYNEKQWFVGESRRVLFTIDHRF